MITYTYTLTHLHTLTHTHTYTHLHTLTHTYTHKHRTTVKSMHKPIAWSHVQHVFRRSSTRTHTRHQGMFVLTESCRVLRIEATVGPRVCSVRALVRPPCASARACLSRAGGSVIAGECGCFKHTNARYPQIQAKTYLRKCESINKQNQNNRTCNTGTPKPIERWAPEQNQ